MAHTPHASMVIFDALDQLEREPFASVIGSRMSTPAKPKRPKLSGIQQRTQNELVRDFVIQHENSNSPN